LQTGQFASSEAPRIPSVILDEAVHGAIREPRSPAEQNAEPIAPQKKQDSGRDSKKTLS
jgi:hypothetical protein